MVFSHGDKIFLFFLTNEHVNEVKVTTCNFWYHSDSDKTRYVNGSCLGLRTINSLSLLVSFIFSFVYFFKMLCFGRISGIIKAEFSSTENLILCTHTCYLCESR